MEEQAPMAASQRCSLKISLWEAGREGSLSLWEGAGLAPPFRRGGWPGKPLHEHQSSPLPSAWRLPSSPWSSFLLSPSLGAGTGRPPCGELWRQKCWRNPAPPVGKRWKAAAQPQTGASRPASQGIPALFPVEKASQHLPPSHARRSKPRTKVAKAVWLQLSWFAVGCDNGWWRTSVCSCYTLGQGSHKQRSRTGPDTFNPPK